MPVMGTGFGAGIVVSSPCWLCTGRTVNRVKPAIHQECSELAGEWQPDAKR